MHIAICENDALTLNELKTLVCKWSEKKKIHVNLETFNNGEHFIIDWDDLYPFDIFMLDIMMDSIDGFELAKMIRERDSMAVIIFISAAEEYQNKGYLVDAKRYILKPYQAEDVFEALDAAYELALLNDRHTIAIPLREETVRLSARDITCVCKNVHDIVVYTYKGRKLEYNSRFEDFMQIVPEEVKHFFYKCHKSFIVNLKYVYTINKGVAILSGDNQPTIKVAEARRPEFIKEFSDFHRRDKHAQ